MPPAESMLPVPAATGWFRPPRFHPLHPMPASRLLVAVVMIASLRAADLPPPRVIPVAPMNLTPGGPPIPTTPPGESAHSARIPLWPNGAPGFEARKDEPEQVSYRQEADIVFPVLSNVQNPSI